MVLIVDGGVQVGLQAPGDISDAEDEPTTPEEGEEKAIKLQGGVGSWVQQSLPKGHTPNGEVVVVHGIGSWTAVLRPGACCVRRVPGLQQKHCTGSPRKEKDSALLRSITLSVKFLWHPCIELLSVHCT